MAGPWTCRICGETHAREDHLVLHMGRLHPERLDEAERSDFAKALAAEDAWFRRFRHHVHASFAALPVLLFYVVTVAFLMEMNGNPAYPVMLLPGVAMFCALLYGMTYSRLASPRRDPGR